MTSPRLPGRLVAGLAAAAASAALAAPARAATSPTGLPACALGTVPPALTTVLPTAIERERARYANSLGSLPAADRGRATAAFSAGVAAYLYGMPTVLTRMTATTYIKNRLFGVGALATPESRTVVSPNHDTLYSVSQVDLRSGPLVVEAPATAGRYSVIQLLDAYSNVVGYIGASGAAETVALVPPGYSGPTPRGARIVRSPTQLVWALGRTLVDGPGDVETAKALMRGYSLTALDAYLAGSRVNEVVLNTPAGPRPKIVIPTGAAFFDALGAALAADPPPGVDACALKVFARAGIGPGKAPSVSGDTLLAGALAAAERAGSRLVDRSVTTIRRDSQKRHNGWLMQSGPVGRFGTNYPLRATVARVGLAANTSDEAIYPNTDTDDRGRALNGANDYVVTFEPGQLPPVRAFWSLTLYDADHFLVANPIDRYSVGDRTPGLVYGSGMSLKVYIGHDPPAGAAARANWLPAPAGRFELHLRLYRPTTAASKGKWLPPTVTRVP